LNVLGEVFDVTCFKHLRHFMKVDEELMAPETSVDLNCSLQWTTSNLY